MKSKSTAVFEKTQHWLLSWEKWSRSTLFHLIYLWLVIISSHMRLELPRTPFPFMVSHHNILCTSFFWHAC